MQSSSFHRGVIYAPNDDVVLKCVSCGREYPLYEKIFFCPCGGLLEVHFRVLPSVSWSVFRARSFRLWRYRELIPLPENARIVSMGEGGTPLFPLEESEHILGVRRLFVKHEGLNPTGSFKDRGMTVAVSLAANMGYRFVSCASTGNTASSMAAYAARAGLKSFTVLPEGKVARGKLLQAIHHGATVIRIKGGFDDALSAVIEASRRTIVYPLNSINPWRIEGQKTLGYEIADELGTPDWIVLPVGNGGNISAVWKGFKELYRSGLIDSLPRLAGVQAKGANPLAEAFRKGLDKPVFQDSPETIATAIRIGGPVNWEKALNATRESKGVIIDVSDEEIIKFHRILARRWGVGVEPASAASIAGVKALSETGVIDRDDTVVAVLTGHSLKDPDAMAIHDAVMLEAKDKAEAIELLEKNMSKLSSG